MDDGPGKIRTRACNREKRNTLAAVLHYTTGPKCIKSYPAASTSSRVKTVISRQSFWGGGSGIEPPSPGWSPAHCPLCYPRSGGLNRIF